MKRTNHAVVTTKTDRLYPPVIPFGDQLTTLRVSTHEEHAAALLDARRAFEVRLAQAVAFRAIQALDAITQN